MTGGHEVAGSIPAVLTKRKEGSMEEKVSEDVSGFCADTTGRTTAALARMALPYMMGMPPLRLPKMRTRYPWHNINLSKQERKGKSFKEQQALRKSKWEALQLVSNDKEKRGEAL